MIRFSTLALGLCFFLSSFSARAQDDKEPTPPVMPLGPAEAAKTIHIPERFTLELVVAEPLVLDPVSVAWGIDGKLWVAEMADYPLGLDGKGKPGGRVRFLEDTDGDGTYDRSQVFLKEVPFVNGVLPWGKGVLATAAPDIIYAEDTDGDGKADIREKIFSGFSESNQQLRVNGLQRGLDNWVHCASGSPSPRSGLNKGIVSAKTGEKHPVGTRDFRFLPDSGELDPLSGPTQFGRFRDELGNWFGCMNSYPVWHYVLPDRYLRRNTHVTPPDTRRQLVLPRNPRVYPAKAPQKRFHSFEQTGRFTSACGPTIYRDELLYPRDGKTHAFTCEPFHNLVQHNVLEEDGVSFRSHRDETEGPYDFFASTDRWCRPVMARTGPDGALWVVDMYRFIIEHPQFLTDVGREELEPFYRTGNDRGRIWRIYPDGKKPRSFPALTRMKPDALLDQLENPNGQVRDLAQRRIIEVGRDNAGFAKDAAALLSEAILKKERNAFCRLHSLWTLEGLNALDAGTVISALEDSHPGVRKAAVRLSERFSESNSNITTKLAALVDDPHPHVRLQLAFSLGAFPADKTAAQALAKLAPKDSGDAHFEAAVLSSVSETNMAPLIETALTVQDGNGGLIGKLLAVSVAFKNDDATRDGLKNILESDADDSWKFGVVAGLLDALQQHRTSLEKLTEPDHKELLKGVRQLTRKARSVVADEKAKLAQRSIALKLLGRSADAKEKSGDVALLGSFLKSSASPGFQKDIIRHLGSLDSPDVAEVLLADWRHHLPRIRTEILGILPTRKEWATTLLDQVEAGKVPLAQLPPDVLFALRRGADKNSRARAVKLIAAQQAGTKSRAEVLKSWQPALKLVGDRKKGAEHFKAVCSTCHKLDGVGLEVGPNLASISDRRPEALLISILDPNAQLDSRYANYVATLKDGRIVTGYLAGETANSISLVAAGNIRTDVLRTDLKTLEGTNVSLMPEGLEAAMDHQAMADLISYIAKAGLPGEE